MGQSMLRFHQLNIMWSSYVVALSGLLPSILAKADLGFFGEIHGPDFHGFGPLAHHSPVPVHHVEPHHHPEPYHVEPYHPEPYHHEPYHHEPYHHPEPYHHEPYHHHTPTYLHKYHHQSS